MTTSQVTKISTLIKSPRTLKALRDAGFVETSDLTGKTTRDLADIAYVGPVAIEALGPFLALPTPDHMSDVEEGDHPLEIQSPNPGQMIVLLSGQRVNAGGGSFKIQPGVYLKCRNGRGQITREMWFMRRYSRDVKRVSAAITNKTPWRVEAAEWIRRRRAHGRSYFLMAN